MSAVTTIEQTSQDLLDDIKKNKPDHTDLYTIRNLIAEGTIIPTRDWVDEMQKICTPRGGIPAALDVMIAIFEKNPELCEDKDVELYLGKGYHSNGYLLNFLIASIGTNPQRAQKYLPQIFKAVAFDRWPSEADEALVKLTTKYPALINRDLINHIYHQAKEAYDEENPTSNHHLFKLLKKILSNRPDEVIAYFGGIKQLIDFTLIENKEIDEYNTAATATLYYSKEKMTADDIDHTIDLYLSKDLATPAAAGYLLHMCALQEETKAILTQRLDALFKRVADAANSNDHNKMPINQQQKAFDLLALGTQNDCFTFNDEQFAAWASDKKHPLSDLSGKLIKQVVYLAYSNGQKTTAPAIFQYFYGEFQNAKTLLDVLNTFSPHTRPALQKILESNPAFLTPDVAQTMIDKLSLPEVATSRYKGDMTPLLAEAADANPSIPLPPMSHLEAFRRKLAQLEKSAGNKK